MFKLARNLKAAKTSGVTRILSFGGHNSNHIAALAAICKKENLESIGIIRGEEPALLSDTLVKAQSDGMKLKFVSRGRYSLKNDDDFISSLRSEFGEIYIIPEGGSNMQGVLGCMDIIDPAWEYDYVICACGTGTTFAGIMASGIDKFSVIGMSVLKGTNTLPGSVTRLLNQTFPGKQVPPVQDHIRDLANGKIYAIINTYAFSGFAGYDDNVHAFKINFEERYKIPLDYIYTSKLFYGVFDLFSRYVFPASSKVLVIHSGGLQGNAAFEKRYQLNARR